MEPSTCETHDSRADVWAKMGKSGKYMGPLWDRPLTSFIPLYPLRFKYAIEVHYFPGKIAVQKSLVV
jgi:hypothetical protein